MRFGVIDTPDGTTAAVWEGPGQSGAWHRLDAPDLSALLARTTLVEAALDAGGPVPGEPVLPLPAPGKVICCGLNYGDHIRETGREAPAYPTLFAKYADTLVGPTDDIVIRDDVDADWEAELAVVVGATIKDADRATAEKAIAGF